VSQLDTKMAPKKKKQALAKVNRGFATTSIPKKVVDVAPEPAVEPAKDETAPSPQLTGENGKNEKNGDVKEEWEAENSEEAALQQLVDKVKPAAEKEITRTLKVRAVLIAWLALLSTPLLFSGD
jgi:ATP-dependent RNA helicase DHX29